jgi:NAD(P)-dependent dehydrogenase (short-subunit alcohol dehydrogenase family)
MMNELAGKVALVTGGTKGIGKAISLKLAELGADVVVTFLRSRNAADAIIDQLKSLGTNPHAIRINMGAQEKLPKIFTEIKEKYGRLDILVFRTPP